MSLCDLCGRPVEADQPRFGGVGRGDKTGAPVGQARHYDCHTERFGRSNHKTGAELFAELRQLVSNPAVAVTSKVKVPPVTKGELNRSENAARPFTMTNIIREMGRRRGTVVCPFCNTAMTVYVWSLSGGGKRCPCCSAFFGSLGLAYPLVGNEEM